MMPALRRVAEIAEQVAREGKQRKVVTVNGVPFNTAERGYCLRFVRLALTAAIREVDPSYVFGAQWVADPEWSYFPWFAQYASQSCQKLQKGGEGLFGHYGHISTPSPGDIVGFEPYSRPPGHIAIFLGGGRIAENTSSAERGPGTVISSLEHPTLQGRAHFFRVLPQQVGGTDLLVVGPDGKPIVCAPTEEDGVTTADLQPLVEALNLQLQASIGVGGYGQMLTSTVVSWTARVRLRRLLEACGYAVNFVVHPDGRQRIYVQHKEQRLDIPEGAHL
jgi:hypothetical protein